MIGRYSMAEQQREPIALSTKFLFLWTVMCLGGLLDSLVTPGLALRGSIVWVSLFVLGWAIGFVWYLWRTRRENDADGIPKIVMFRSVVWSLVGVGYVGFVATLAWLGLLRGSALAVALKCYAIGVPVLAAHFLWSTRDMGAGDGRKARKAITWGLLWPAVLLVYAVLWVFAQTVGRR
jgi:hypothetical protein